MNAARAELDDDVDDILSAKLELLDRGQLIELADDLMTALADIAFDRTERQRVEKTARRALLRTWRVVNPDEKPPTKLTRTPPPPKDEPHDD